MSAMLKTRTLCLKTIVLKKIQTNLKCNPLKEKTQKGQQTMPNSTDLKFKQFQKIKKKDSKEHTIQCKARKYIKN